MKPHKGLVVGGRYRLDEPLARGGMGTVWAATHLELDTQVAIKFLDEMRTTDVESQLRFRREARATARLRGPNIVQIHDFGVEEQRRFLVMELLHGEDLGARLRRTPRLPFAAVRSIVCQVAKALDRVHAAGVVHRDIKPGNIFLTRSEDGDEVVKLVDFGLVHFKSPQEPTPVTVSGVVLGTPHFMAPEQARDCAKVDHRSDLWSLAAVAYRALTGEPVVAGSNVVEVLMHIARRSIRPPSMVASDLSETTDRFFEKALALSPEERFQTASELARAFVAIARDPRASVAAVSAPLFDEAGDARPTTPAASTASQEALLVRAGSPRLPSDVGLGSDVNVDSCVDHSGIARAASKYRSLDDDLLGNDDSVKLDALPRRSPEASEGSMTLPRLHVSNGPAAPWRVAASRADARRNRTRILAASLAAIAALGLAAFTFEVDPKKSAPGRVDATGAGRVEDVSPPSAALQQNEAPAADTTPRTPEKIGARPAPRRLATNAPKTTLGKAAAPTAAAPPAAAAPATSPVAAETAANETTTSPDEKTKSLKPSEVF